MPLTKKDLQGVVGESVQEVVEKVDGLESMFKAQNIFLDTRFRGVETQLRETNSKIDALTEAVKDILQKHEDEIGSLQERVGVLEGHAPPQS